MDKLIIGIIPARFGSTRFPGKPLIDIRGKTMIQRVYEQARKCGDLADVIVATDDERIEKAVSDFGGNVCLTSIHHPTGTDRCAEVVEKLKLACDSVVNIQGDEPFIEPEQISLLCSCFTDERTQIATLVRKITSPRTLFDPNAPKVLINEDGFALYFSRQTIPHLRGIEEKNWINNHSFYQHIGIYGYRVEVLKKITKLKPSALEKAESLEQLRWIEHGYKIKTAITSVESIAIDTPDDLKRMLESTPR